MKYAMQRIKGVSRETNEALDEFTRDLLKWTRKINLIAPSTQDEIWSRHIRDSAQLWPLGDRDAAMWCDLGSGGGLPGLVLAILAKGQGAETQFRLIESDGRKSAFLSTMIAKFDLPAKAVTERIETATPVGAEIISARALAPLSTLLGYAVRHGSGAPTFLLQKGAQFQNEIDAARESWHFHCESIRSQTHPDAVILKIKEVSRV